MKKEPLSLIAIKTLLAVIIFTGVGTIIIGGGWLIGNNYENKTDDKIVKPVDQEMRKCVKEGEKFYLKPGEPQTKKCCSNLKTGAFYSIIDDKCIPETVASICIDCPNGICGPGENKCNCPEDCDKSKMDIKIGRGELDDGIDVAKLQEEVDSGDQSWRELYEGPCYGNCGQNEFRKRVRLNPDLILPNLKSYGFDDVDIKNAREVLNESGKKVYQIQHKTDSYLITLSQPVVGLFKVWIISKIELKEKVCQPKLIGIKLRNEDVNRIFEEVDNRLYPILSTEQFAKKGYKMYCVNWYYLDELPDEILNELPESDFADNLKSVDTENWSLYQNEEIKLSFFHPAGWRVKKGMSWGDKWAEPFYYLGPFNAGPLSIKRMDTPCGRSGKWGIDSLGTVTINGQKTFMLKSTLSGDGRVSYYTKLYVSDHYFYIEYTTKYNSEDDNKSNESVFKNVLLTFRPYQYSGKDDTTQWSSFRSEKDGFTMKHPDDIIYMGYTVIDNDYRYLWTKGKHLNPFIMVTVSSLGNLSLDEWIKENKISTYYGKENIILSNATFLKYYDAAKGFYNFYTVNEDKVYTITLIKRHDVIKKILSTFKFIEK